MQHPPYILPPCPALPNREAVATHAQSCLAAVGLEDWHFVWDRAVKRMGCCRPALRTISLSRYFVEAYLSIDPQEIHLTLLHEIAHALAWQHRRARAHGAIWRQYCSLLGLTDMRATKPLQDFTPPHLQRQPRYALCHAQTGEILRYYKSRPRRSAAQWRHCYIPGRKNETLGQLIIKQIYPESPYKDISDKTREN